MIILKNNQFKNNSSQSLIQENLAFYIRLTTILLKKSWKPFFISGNYFLYPLLSSDFYNKGDNKDKD